MIPLDGLRRCERRGCHNTFLVDAPNVPRKGPTKKRFCCKTCRQMEGQYRRGIHKRLEFGVCRNGHDITPENTKIFVWGGKTRRVCLVCREAQEKNPKRIAYQKEWELRNRDRRNAEKRAHRAVARKVAV